MRFHAGLAVMLFATVPPTSTTNLTYFSPAKDVTSPVISPDGKHVLRGDMRAGRVWLHDDGGGADRLVARITVQTASAAWSPDSQHFALNDRRSSDTEDSFVVDAATLKQTSLRDLLRVRPDFSHYENQGELSHGRQVLHSYLHVVRWVNRDAVEVELHGTTSGGFANGDPNKRFYEAECFDVRYQVRLDGAVTKLSEHLQPMTTCPNAVAGWGFDAVQ